MPETASQTIARWAADERDDAHDLTSARVRAHDLLGCALAAAALGEASAVGAQAAHDGGRAEASAVGLAGRLPAAAAALVNGTLAHALDYDDTHDVAICHVSTVVVPAALAAGEATGASLEAILAAATIGGEITIRLGAAAPRAFHARGFHPTGVCGVFGAAVAAGRLYGLDAGGHERALGLCGSLASGIFEYLSDGSPTKPLHAGWAASAGVRAAQLAARGMRGPASVLEGRFGLLATHADGADPAALTRELSDLGERWATDAIALKAYPVCHFSHGALDALGTLDVAAEEIERIDATIAAAGAPLVSEPPEDKLAPASPYAARFSLPYALAARAVHGDAEPERFAAPALTDAGVLELTPRIAVATWGPGEDPSAFGGAVRVRLRDGSERRAQADAPTGLDAAGAAAKAQRNGALAGVDFAQMPDDVAELTATLRAATHS